MVKLYNTLNKKIEEFIPNNKDLITMYTCGPTVYHYAHIGNLRTYIFEDILEKGSFILDAVKEGIKNHHWSINPVFHKENCLIYIIMISQNYEIFFSITNLFI